MAKQKNKSFVELKENKTNNQENIIDPFKQYEYIEPKKKIAIKQIMLVIAIIIAIILVVIFLKIINSYSDKPINDNSMNLNKTSTTILKLQTTTTNAEINKEQITETLVCSSVTTENNIQFDTIVTAHFYNRKLRFDENFMSITLLNKAAQEEFDNYVTYLQMFVLYSVENDDYEIDTYSEENKFGFSIKTIYQKDQTTESSLSYDEDYEVVKQKLIELGHNCQ